MKEDYNKDGRVEILTKICEDYLELINSLPEAYRRRKEKEMTENNFPLSSRGQLFKDFAISEADTL